MIPFSIYSVDKSCVAIKVGFLTPEPSITVAFVRKVGDQWAAETVEGLDMGVMPGRKRVVCKAAIESLEARHKASLAKCF